MITKDLESKLVTAITSALSSLSQAHQIVGSWQGAFTESDSSVAVVAVALGTPEMPTYSSPVVKFTGSVTLAIRNELDTTGEALVAFADALVNLFKTWQSETYQQAFTALDVTGLSIDEVSVQGGQPPIRSRDNRSLTITFPFVLSGSYRSTTTTTTTTN